MVGPTASGKTSLGIYLAQKLGRLPAGRQGEVVSADSRQVYRGLNIGTGKVTKKEMAGVPHHLLDVVSPRKQFTVDDFVKKAARAITTIYRSAHVPIVVGGTGLYADMLLGRMSYPNVPPNLALRAQLDKKSVAQLLAQLKKLDPARAATIEPHHKRRIIRAIEIAKAIGQSPKARTSDAQAKYDVLWLGLNPGAHQLKQNIAKRLRARLAAGMVAEAKRLHTAGLSYKRMDELGLEYRYLALLLQHKISKEEFAEQLERAISRYAKRQNKWFKRNPGIHWVKNKPEALRLATKFLSGR